MITGLRSALLCDRFEQSADGLASYIGIHGDTLVAPSRPAILTFWINLIVEVDGRPTTGQVQVHAPNFERIVPFDAPRDLKITAVALPVMLVVMRKGPITVTIKDDAPRGPTLRCAWMLDIARDAEILDADATADFLMESLRDCDNSLAQLAARRRRAH